MTQQPLEYGVTYHIYNQGNNGETIFPEERNYKYFMQLYGKYIAPIADTFAYCLLRNHFHFLIRIKDETDLPGFQNLEGLKLKPPYRYFSNFFNAYTKAFNKSYERPGSLFEKNFKRKPVTNDTYFTTLITYIHHNPQTHGLIDDYRDWPYSSYPALIGRKVTRLARDEVLGWFDDRQGFVNCHDDMVDFRQITALVEGDFD